MVVVAGKLALDHHEGGDPRKPALVAERPSQQLSLVEVVAHARPITEREKRVSEVEPYVDSKLGCRPGLGEPAKRS